MGWGAVLLAALLAPGGGCGHGSRPVHAAALAPGVPTATAWNTRDGDTDAYLVSVDDKPVPYKQVLFFHDTAQPVIVPAGVHRLEVTIDHRNRVAGVKFDFSFQAGHVYLIQHVRGRDDQVEMVDETAGTAVRIGPSGPA